MGRQRAFFYQNDYGTIYRGWWGSIEKWRFYKEVSDDPSKEVIEKVENVVKEMLERNEIYEKTATFLKGGDKQLSKFFHLLKVHKILKI